MDALICAMSAWKIALCVVAVLAVAALIVALVAIQKRRTARRDKEKFGRTGESIVDRAARRSKDRFDRAGESIEERAARRDKERLGRIGESIVEQIIGKTQFGKQYVLNNYAAYHEGRTFEVDHIVINPRGIFVLETKNWAGEVFGAEDDEMWIQRHGHGKYETEEPHPNPIMQNSGHVYHISKILGGEYRVEPVVVMANNNGCHIESDKVVDLRDLASYLIIFGPPIYSASEMEYIYKALLDYQKKVRRFPPRTRRIH